MLSAFYHKSRLLIRAYKYLSGYDRYEIEYVRDNLNSGDIAFDIGAHKGAYTYWMRKSVKQSGKIISIEPQPILFDYLKRVFKIFGYDNVILKNCAISEKDTQGEITVPGMLGNTSQGARIDDYQIVQNKHKNDLHTINVKVRSIDSIIEETGIKPNLIKIDVEGHEFNVLRGMINALENIRPKIILECEERHIKGLTVFDTFNFIIKYNYNGFFYREGKKMALNQFDLNRDQLKYFNENIKLDQNYVNNFIFEPN